jgi:tyrocidine synthetase-3
MPEIYALSLPQKDVYYDQLLFENSAIYNIGAKVKVQGPLDEHIFYQAAQQLVAQHDSLRSIIVTVDRVPHMQILETAIVDVAYADFSGHDDPANAADHFVQEHFSQPFDLASGKLLNNYTLVKVSEQLFYIIGKYHHLIADGWSTALLFSRLGNNYSCIRCGEHIALRTFSYTDFIEDDLQYTASEEYVADQQYWRGKLQGFEDPVWTRTIAGKENEPIHSNRKEIFLDRPLYDQIIDYAAREGISVFHFLTGAVYACFSPLFDGDTFIMGLPLLNRKTKKFKETVGLFAGITPLLFGKFRDITFAHLLKGIKVELRENFRHQRLALSKIMSDAGWLKGVAGRPAYQIFFSYEKHDYAISFDGHTATVLPLTHHLERAPMAVYVREFDNFREVKVDIDYNTAYFDAALMDNCVARFQHLLAELLAAPEQLVGDISLLDATAAARLLHTYNDTATAYPLEKTLVDLFTAQVERSPLHAAVEYNGRVLSYRELAQHAGRLSCTLQQSYHICGGELVGIMTERSWQMVAGILGILGSGAAYVPIDPDHPDARIRYILEQSKVKVVVTTARYQDWLEQQGFTTVLMSAEALAAEMVVPEAGIDSSALAYVMYTSGSTGQPKGVEIPHRAVVNFLCSMQSTLQLPAAFRLLAVTTYSFDISVLELLLPLVSGGTIIVLDREHIQNALLLSRSIDAYRPDIMQCTPGMWQMLLDTGWQGDGVMTALCGGERMPEDLARQLLPATGACWNMYGPTETTIWSAMQRITQAADAGSIGKPIGNTSIYILNSRLQLLPEGIAGDIYIGGEGLASGYRDQPTLTATRFTPHPFNASGRIYRTGDVGKWDSNGRIIFMGRSDEQVKIRGYRVEPGEIEQVLQTHAQVKQAVVTAEAGQDGSSYLVAYVVLSGDVTIAALRGYAAEVLPAYMVPGYFMVLDKLPMSANGKVDKKSLPAATGSMVADNNASYVAATTPLEALLVKIWEEVLGREGIGIHDNFFETGGHSLRAMQIISRIHKELGVELSLQQLFNQPEIATLATIIQGAGAAGNYEDITVVAQQEYYELSHAQRRLWILSQFRESSLAYNIAGAYRMKGTLDKASFRKALTQVVARHESLRTIFITVDDMPVQKVLTPEELNFSLEEYDIRGANAWTHATEMAGRELEQAFDLAHGPLIRAKLLQTGEDEQVFLLTLHHIITDGWSMEVIVKELLQLYEAYRADLPDPLSPLRLQYRDYASWQHRQMNSDRVAPHRQYWMEQLSGSISLPDLPVAKKRPEKQTFKGDRTTHCFDTRLSEQLKSISRQKNASIFMTLLAAFKVLLHHYTAASDIVIGTPVSGRDHAGCYDQVGCFMNMLVIRTGMKADEPFDVLIEKIKTGILNGQRHQSYPFDVLVEELQLPRYVNRSPLFDIVVGMDTNILSRSDDPVMDGLVLEKFTNQHAVSKYDLTCMFRDTSDGISMTLEYNTALYEAATVQMLISQYTVLLHNVVAVPQQCIGDISLLDATATARLLHTYNDTATAYPLEKTLVDLFTAQVERSPLHAAVECNGRVLSYRELAQHAGRLSCTLQQSYHICGGDLVGIMTERSWQMVAGILGILGSGAAYVPIDPDHPDARIRYILEQSKVKVVVTTVRYRDWLEQQGFTTVLISEDGLTADIEVARPGIDSSGLAYVMYTSGSTGQPKGVEIPHRAVVNFLCSMQSTLQLPAAFRLLAVTTYSFDISVLELLLPLVSGGTVIVLDREHIQNALLLSRSIDAYRPDIMQCTPGMWQMLLDTGWQGDGVMTALCGGERMPEDLARQLLPATGACWNMYGPTETTIWSAMQRITQAADAGSIGKPIGNTSIYILNSRLQLLPEGIAGDIYIGGEGLASGYRDQPTLTATRFTPHPFNASGRIYRTGDVGKWDSNGRIIFMGRSDEQVKIRGYRVEPGEVEQVLQTHAQVKQAVVTAEAGQDGSSYLVAYVVLSGDVTITALRGYAAEVLPAYMVPGYFMVLDKLPMSANGKVDKKSLPAAAGSIVVDNNASYVAATTPLEALLVKIWEEVLGREGIGIHDNFFEAGGHSLRAMQIISRIHKELGVELGLHELFLQPEIAALATIITELGAAGNYEDITTLAPQEYYELSHAQQRLWILSQFPEGSLAYNIAGAYRVKGTLDKASFRKALMQVVARHESLRTIFITVDNRPVQKVLEPQELRFSLEEYDIRGANAWAHATEMAGRELEQVFDLAHGPLIRAKLLQTGEDEQVFLLTLHHIITDGWSMEVIVKELLQLYEAYRGDLPDPLSPLRLQYRDYASWQNKQLKSEALLPHRQYWMEQLGGGIPVLELPYDYSRPDTFIHRGGKISAVIPQESYLQLSQLGGLYGVSLYMLLMAASKALLYRYTGQPDIVVGYPVSLRNYAALENQVGFYLNTLALRTGIAGNNSFRDLVLNIKSSMLKAGKHQQYPFDKLVSSLRYARSANRSPLFDVVVVLQNLQVHQQEVNKMGDLEVSVLPTAQVASSVDLRMEFIERSDFITANFEYNMGLFHSDTIELFMNRFLSLLSQVLANPDMLLEEIVFEKEQVMAPAHIPADHFTINF